MENKLAKYLFITLAFELFTFICLFLTIIYSIYFLLGFVIFGIFFVIYLIKTFKEKKINYITKEGKYDYYLIIVDLFFKIYYNIYVK